jgi:carboxyl-terminal processing protease
MKKRIQFAILAGISLLFVAFKSDPYFEIAKNIEIFIEVYKKLQTMYVEDVNPGEIMQEGIKAMLKKTDPYTVYYPEALVENAQIERTSTFGGIGIEILEKEKEIVISSIVENSPADKNKLHIGDQIISIDNNKLNGKKPQEVDQLIKGQKGTKIKLEIKQKFPAKKRTVELTRVMIKQNSIPYFGVLEDGVGYIRLTSFTRNCASEFKKAVVELKDSLKINSLIIDLRFNPGGLLNEAVDLCNLFIPKGKIVVSTKGKLEDTKLEYKTRFSSFDEKMPIIVLVNGRSASASEIISGTLQDYDRGLVLGERTYGKGLVQRTVPMAYRSQMKITIAKYYTPSGRCIQAINYASRNADGSVSKIPDNLRNTFYTQNGRKVLDGGGVDPDIEVPFSNIPKDIEGMEQKHVFFEFSNQYAYQKDISSIEEIGKNKKLFSEFSSFLKDKNYPFPIPLDKSISTIEKIAEKENKNYDTELSTLKNRAAKEKLQLLEKHKKYIDFRLKQEIAQRLFFEKGKALVGINADVQIMKALGILKNTTEYNKLLK